MKVKRVGDDGLRYYCQGCQSSHMIKIGQGAGPRWGWNGSMEAPTFSPSVMVTYDGPDAGVDGAPPAVCHTFIKDGRVQFLGDCTHQFAGTTQALPDIPCSDPGEASEQSV